MFGLIVIDLSHDFVIFPLFLFFFVQQCYFLTLFTIFLSAIRAIASFLGFYCGLDCFRQRPSLEQIEIHAVLSCYCI